jgi:hypothetical protein
MRIAEVARLKLHRPYHQLVYRAFRPIVCGAGSKEKLGIAKL